MFIKRFSHVKTTFSVNGKEAIELVKQNSFDLILMDINMPVMNGMEATIIIREELRLNVPIIALTANALKGDKEQFIALGMNGYLSKPLELNDISNILELYF